MELSMDIFKNSSMNTYLLIMLLLVIIAGIIMGFKEIITVYRDYDDLGIAFLLVLSPIVLIYLFSLGNANNATSNIFIGLIEIVLVVWLSVRTFKDNGNNVLFTLIAIITKFSLSILFVINLLQLVSPSGKTSSQRSSSKRNAFAILLLISPIVFALVKSKEGIFNPARTLSRRGISI